METDGDGHSGGTRHHLRATVPAHELARRRHDGFLYLPRDGIHSFCCCLCVPFFFWTVGSVERGVTLRKQESEVQILCAHS